MFVASLVETFSLAIRLRASEFGTMTFYLMFCSNIDLRSLTDFAYFVMIVSCERSSEVSTAVGLSLFSFCIS